ncbi:hypothetical protein JZ751_022323 [Albula glossodonta]|uniref:Torsin-1A C-terminal domain-containing protein n=1 Tax=Albula glossodonta TaxID=121402 RepID=A0A8T2MQQ0_9TELE|nr:hypothetical protein JZ751_022323 [Albula glossodonta]
MYSISLKLSQLTWIMLYKVPLAWACSPSPGLQVPLAWACSPSPSLQVPLAWACSPSPSLQVPLAWACSPSPSLQVPLAWACSPSPGLQVPLAWACSPSPGLQHLASRVILKAVKGFMADPNPSKPLVLSLHGSSGTGKNLVAKIIAQNLFEGGEFSSQVDGVSFTHAIFVFLSNQGGHLINQMALEFWKADKPREEIKLNSQGLETAINKDVFNNKNKMSALGLAPDTSMARNVAADMPFFPQEERLFSVKGCKSVKQRLKYYI